MKAFRLLLLTIFPLLMASLVFAAVRVRLEDPAYDEYEGLALLEALVRDGHFELAQKSLDRVGESERQAQRSRWLRLQGDLSANSGEAKAVREARVFYTEALLGLREEKLKREILIRRAKVEFATEDMTACAESLAFLRPGDLEASADVVLLKVSCERRAGQIEQAWTSLKAFEAQDRWDAIIRERLRWSLELGLFEEARRESWKRIPGLQTPTEALALVELWVQKEQWGTAAQLLDGALLRFPGEVDLVLAQAPLWHRVGFPRQAIESFARASWSQPRYAYHTAELLRQSERMTRARLYQFFIPDDKEALKQKIAVEVDRGRYDLIAASLGPLSRSSLSQDQDVSYAMAYSLMRAERSQQAESWLSRITRPDLLPRAVQLMSSLKTEASSK